MRLSLSINSSFTQSYEICDIQNIIMYFFVEIILQLIFDWLYCFHFFNFFFHMLNQESAQSNFIIIVQINNENSLKFLQTTSVIWWLCFE